MLKLPRIGRFNTPRSAIITDYSCDAGEKKKKKKKKKGGVRVAASRCANLHNEATRTGYKNSAVICLRVRHSKRDNVMFWGYADLNKSKKVVLF